MITVQEMMAAELEKFRGAIISLVQGVFEQYKEVNPGVFLLVRHEGKFVVNVATGLGQLFSTPEGKDAAAGIIKQMSKELKPVAIAFCSEGWYLEMDKEDGMDYLDKKGNIKNGKDRPSTSPDRKEMLFITFETFDKDGNLSWDIVREDGKDPVLKEKINTNWSLKNKDLPKTRFSNLLEENYSVVAQELEKQLVNQVN